MKHIHKKQVVRRIEPESLTNRTKTYVMRQVNLRAAKNPKQPITIMVAPSLNIAADDFPQHITVLQVAPDRLRKMGGACTIAISLMYENRTPEPEVYTDHA